MRKLFVLALLFVGCAGLRAQETNLFTVEARGVGVTEEAALRDAFSQAVQQAAGAIVDSRTLMKNDEIVQEKILTASNAIIKKYEIVKPAKRNGSGLYEVKIRAVVEQNLLRHKMIEHKIIVGEVAGAQNLWAEAVSQEKNQGDMLAMLENTLNNVDLAKYMSFDILGKNGIQGSKAELGIDVQNGQVTITFGLVCQFDDRRFQQEVMPHLRRIFDELPFEGRHPVVLQPGEIKLPFKFPKQDQPMRQYRTMNIFPNYDDVFKHIENDCRVEEKGNLQYCGIMLNTSPKFRPNMQKFVCYHFPKKMPEGSIGKWNKLVWNLGENLKRVSVSLCLIGADGEEIHRITRKIGDPDKGPVVDHAAFFPWKNMRGFLVISPNYIFTEILGGSNLATPLCIIPVEGTMNLEDLKEVKSFKLEVDFGKR